MSWPEEPNGLATLLVLAEGGYDLRVLGLVVGFEGGWLRSPQTGRPSLSTIPCVTCRSLKALVGAHCSNVPISTRRSLTSDHFVQLRGGLLLKAPQHVAVNVKRESNRGVPQSLLNDLWMYTRLEQQRGSCMA